MPLSARELLLVVRARDQASRVIQQASGSVRGLGNAADDTAAKLSMIGGAMIGVGTTLVATGALGVAFFDDAVTSASEFEHGTRLALTQAANLGLELEDMKDIAKRVGAEIPADFQLMDEVLFDIFSTIETDGPGAEFALRELAKASVAGGTEITNVSRVALAALNAYQLPAEEMGRVLDVQFKLVEKGAGTYEEFAAVLGNAIPAAVASGQSIETLAGTMAFLTRNGLSAARASTSSARAMELFSQPDVQEGLKGIGVAVTDADGNFRQLNEIVTDLATNAGWAQMAAPERKKAFEDIFGKGSIQARRFFDLAIPNFEDFNSLTDEMTNSSGAMEDAYAIMFESPLTHAQDLTNQYEIMKTEIGDELLPAKLKLMETAKGLIERWNNLDEGTKKLIVKIAAGAAVFAVIAGTIMTVVGMVLLFIGTIAPLVGGVGAVIAIFSGVGVAIAAAIAIGYLLIRNWDTVKAVALDVWDTIKTHAVEMFDAFMIGAKIVIGHVRDFIKAVRDSDVIPNILKKIKESAQSFWDKLVEVYEWLDENFGEGFRLVVFAVRDAFVEVFTEIGETLTLFGNVAMAVWNGFLWPVFKAMYDVFVWVHERAWAFLQFIYPAFQWAFGLVWTVVKSVVGLITDIWDRFGTTIVETIKVAWNLVTSLIAAAIKIVSNFIALGMNIIQGDWGEAWDNILAIVDGIMDAIWAAINAVWALIKIFFKNFMPAIVGFIGDIFSRMYPIGKDILNGLWDGAKKIFLEVDGWFGGIGSKILNAIGSVGSLLWDTGKNIMGGLWSGLKNKWDEITRWFDQITGQIPDWKGPPARDRKLLTDSGRMIMGGLQGGLEDGWGNVTSYLHSLTPADALSTDTSSIGADPFEGIIRALSSRSENNGTGEQVGIQILGDVTFGSEETVEELDWWAKTAGAGV